MVTRSQAALRSIAQIPVRPAPPPAPAPAPEAPAETDTVEAAPATVNEPAATGAEAAADENRSEGDAAAPQVPPATVTESAEAMDVTEPKAEPMVTDEIESTPSEPATQSQS